MIQKWTAFSENLEISLKGLSTRKMRTFLTALGIIFGVGAVIAMLSIGEGAKREAMDLVHMMGSKHIIISSKEIPSDKVEEVRKFSPGLTRNDVKALEQSVPALTGISTVRKIKVDEVWNDKGKSKADALAVSPLYLEVLNLDIVRGRFISRDDELECSQVCVIGRGIARRIFGQMNPIGQPLKVGRLWYRIIGVAGREFASSGALEGLEAEDVDRIVYIPLTTARAKIALDLNESPLDEISITLSSSENIREIRDYVERMISRLHLDQPDFTITVPLLILKQKQETQRIFNVVMGCIAGISLLVGGIGIMNIMLASVLERIREIGLRRAVGATREQIMFQFLMESTLISGAGGIIGILLGMAIAHIVAYFTEWTTVVSWWSVVLSVGVSTAVGISFGYYPARHAANFNPIKALRYE